MKAKAIYELPTVKVYWVELEQGIAQGYTVSVGAQMIDWEDGGVIGASPDEGGDIYLIF